MTGTKLHWIDGPWPGKLAIASRPRGGDWLDEEMAAWRRESVDMVGSLLTGDENLDLELIEEDAAAKAHAMAFSRFAIPDRGVPASEARFSEFVAKLDEELSAGRNVVIHCRQGVGRSGLVAGCLLVGKGVEPSRAVQRISAARGVQVPETPAQQQWMNQYAATAVAPHHE
jgi:hypothetical protein